MKEKVLLAFSGGLDTSFCAIYLAAEKGYDVHTLTVNTGGFDEKELATIAERAGYLGIKHHAVADCTRDYYDKVIRFLIYGNVLKNQAYPLSVSAERMSQALAVAEYAAAHGISTVAHGSTAAGNDQVRFDLVLQTLLPEVKILTPIRELQLSRQQEIDYLRSHGVEMDFTKAAYSINKGLWGTSVGGVETLQSLGSLPESAWPTQLSRYDSETIVLKFEKGELKNINNIDFEHSALAIQHLQAIAGPFAIGRDIHVGDTIIGIKGRVGFEAAAAILILKAHLALEKHTLTKWQLYWKEQVGQFYGNWLHEGLYLDPVMRDLEAFLESSQATVTGEVHLKLHPYRFEVLGIQSDFDLMSDRYGSYGEMNRSWTGADVQGFTKIFGNQLRIARQVQRDALLKGEES